MIIRGTTPTDRFHISVDTSLIKALEITYSQNGSVRFTKSEENCEIESGDTISVQLSQEDTFSLSDKYELETQLRILTIDNKLLSHLPILRKVGKCNSNEVLR